jgi:hypothetical protein
MGRLGYSAENQRIERSGSHAAREGTREFFHSTGAVIAQLTRKGRKSNEERAFNNRILGFHATHTCFRFGGSRCESSREHSIASADCLPGSTSGGDIPETYVYVVPDIDADIFFHAGWWWRPWEGRWYRSRHHDKGWAHYPHVPAFYKDVPPGWRKGYRDRRWKGHEWEHRHVSHRDAEKNWRSWEKKKHWEKENTWGVKGLEHGKHNRDKGKKPKHKNKK